MVSVQKNAAAEVGAGFLLDLLKRLDIEVGRLVHVQAAEEPEDRDVELPQERSRIEAARPVASHLRVDLSEWFRERRAARAREGGDVGGRADADGRPRLDDRKCDRRLARRGERDHPPTLAAADESDSFWVEVRLPREEARRGRRVVRIGADCLVGRELPIGRRPGQRVRSESDAAVGGLAGIEAAHAVARAGAKQGVKGARAEIDEPERQPEPTEIDRLDHPPSRERVGTEERLSTAATATEDERAVGSSLPDLAANRPPVDPTIEDEIAWPAGNAEMDAPRGDSDSDCIAGRASRRQRDDCGPAVLDERDRRWPG